MGDTSAKEPKATSFNYCDGRKVCSGDVWWNKGSHGFMTARRASITKKAAWTSQFAIQTTEDKLCLFKVEKKEPNEEKVRRHLTKALSLNDYCRVHSDDDVIVTPTSDKRALSVFKLEARGDVTNANDEYFGVETSEASGKWIKHLKQAIQALNDQRRLQRDVEKNPKMGEEQHSDFNENQSTRSTRLSVCSVEKQTSCHENTNLSTRANEHEKTYEMPYDPTALTTDMKKGQRSALDTPPDETSGNQSSSSTRECDGLEYGVPPAEVGDDLIYQDGTLTLAAMWAGSAKAAVEFLEKHKEHEGLYYIRKSLSGSGHTLVVIWNGQPCKLLIEENPDKSVTLLKVNFRDLEMLLQHFSGNNLPDMAIRLQTPYTRLGHMNRL